MRVGHNPAFAADHAGAQMMLRALHLDGGAPQALFGNFSKPIAAHAIFSPPRPLTDPDLRLSELLPRAGREKRWYFLPPSDPVNPPTASALVRD